MKVAPVAALCSMLTGASAFGVARTAAYSRGSSSLMVRVPEEQQSEDLKEIYKIADRWAEIRLYSDEEANEKLSGEELEAYTRYHQKVKDDIEKMQTLAEMMAKSVEIPQVAKKSKTQRKKDAWARRQAIDAANANHEASLTKSA